MGWDGMRIGLDFEISFSKFKLNFGNLAKLAKTKFRKSKNFNLINFFKKLVISEIEIIQLNSENQ